MDATKILKHDNICKVGVRHEPRGGAQFFYEDAIVLEIVAVIKQMY